MSEKPQEKITKFTAIRISASQKLIRNILAEITKDTNKWNNKPHFDLPI